MQTVSKDGIMGRVIEASPENIKNALQDPNVDHVDVFEGSPENISAREKMVGKKFTVPKRFRKTGGNSKYNQK